MTDSQTLLTALRAHVNVCRDCDMVHGRYCKVVMPLAVRFADIRADQVSAERLLRETAVRLPRSWPQEPWERESAAGPIGASSDTRHPAWPRGTSVGGGSGRGALPKANDT